MSDKVKAMSPVQIRQHLAEVAGLSAQQAKLVIENLSTLAVEQVNSIGVFTVPGLCKITKVHKPAKPERKMISPFTKQEVTVKAKPAYNIVKVKPIKALKDAVT